MSQSSDEMGDEEPEFMTEEGSGEGDASGEVVDEDTLRILVSTDNHLGYCERDPIRGFDSFAAFEEVLQLAKAHKVRWWWLTDRSILCDFFNKL